MNEKGKYAAIGSKGLRPTLNLKSWFHFGFNVCRNRNHAHRWNHYPFCLDQESNCTMLVCACTVLESDCTMLARPMSVIE